MPIKCNSVLSSSSLIAKSLSQIPIHVSLGGYGRLGHIDAITHALQSPPIDPVLGRLSTKQLQLCPQNRGQITEDLAIQLKRDYHDIQFRLHANVQLESKARWIDLCDWQQEQGWFKQAAKISQLIQAPAYTAHAGRRQQSVTLQQVFNNTLNAEQQFGIPVGIEGHYPTRNDSPNNHYWWLSSWQEYRQMLDAGVNYALDLSHLHILACQTGCIELSLVQELLASERCLEVHVSGNDGSGDQHQPLNQNNLPWWIYLLSDINPKADVFSEGRQNVFHS